MVALGSGKITHLSRNETTLVLTTVDKRWTRNGGVEMRMSRISFGETAHLVCVVSWGPVFIFSIILSVG